jgi:competence protein ComEA
MRRHGVWAFIVLAAGLASVVAAGVTVELNTATLAQLEAVGGIGTALAARIVEERARRPFTDWDDAQRRLKGLGPKVALRLSEQGLKVNGAPYAAATQTPR